MSTHDVTVANGQAVTTAPNRRPAPPAQPSIPARVPTPFTASHRMHVYYHPRTVPLPFTVVTVTDNGNGNGR